MVIDIREIRPHDKAEWLNLWEGYTRFYGSPQPEEVTECTWQRMLDENSPVLGRVAVVDDTVVGFAICILHEGTWVTTPHLLSGGSVCRSCLPWTRHCQNNH
ncbi:N-acetyltransferase GCN5 [Klebsiella variicola]|nr:N-acetyltransferase GCN5 [Klebsiella variicola]